MCGLFRAIPCNVRVVYPEWRIENVGLREATTGSDEIGGS